MAVLSVGRWVEAKLAENDTQGKPIHRLHDLLTQEPVQTEGFRALGPMGAKKRTVPTAGVW